MNFGQFLFSCCVMLVVVTMTACGAISDFQPNPFQDPTPTPDLPATIDAAVAQAKAPTAAPTTAAINADVYAAPHADTHAGRAERTVAVVANLYAPTNAHAGRVGNTVAIVAHLRPAPYANATLTAVPFNQRRLGGTGESTCGRGNQKSTMDCGRH